MNYLYADSILSFVETDTPTLLSTFPGSEHKHWKQAIDLLKNQFHQLPHLAGDLVLGLNNQTPELRIPVTILYRGLIFTIDIGFNNTDYQADTLDTLHQQARTLKHHHVASQSKFIIPVTLETQATPKGGAIVVSEDLVADPMCDTGEHLAALIEHFANQYKDDQIILADWLSSDCAEHC
ncbi:hypothetical protein [Vibrio aquaticus]|uniref:hypothetical protein n=1 Tax=Vibrio aquaticus TaxID=2496559 RepID=UPI001FC8F4D2|nr:hypothetical protein [Vibrio aquaticus]